MLVAWRGIIPEVRRLFRITTSGLATSELEYFDVRMDLRTEQLAVFLRKAQEVINDIGLSIAVNLDIGRLVVG